MQTSQAGLTERWSLQNVFLDPESAAYDAERQVVFVSNVNRYAKDNNGFVSRVSADGKQLELKWLSGLHSPTGTVAHQGKLYVADYDALVIADIDKAEVLARIPAPDDKPSLNDVAVSDDGRVFVSGSSSSTIYQLVDAELVVWKHDPERLKFANGLLVDGERLLHGGQHWSIFDLASGQLLAGLKAPPPTIKDIDGITRHPCGGYIVTLLDDARLWWVKANGDAAPLSQAEYNGIDLQQHQGTLYVPVVGGGLQVLQMTDDNCAAPHSATE
ncbi:MAG: hypothetical protein HKN50_12920 [Gammaproteobacteria bacterium]|nr:hypothetical protein [Gammaproteobacteria bacterium]